MRASHRTAAVVAVLTTAMLTGGVSHAASSDTQVENWQWTESGEYVPKSEAERLAPLAPLPRMELAAVATIAPGLEHSQYDNGVVEADVLEADLSEPTLRVDYTNPGTVAKRSTMTSQGRTSGTIAAVNGDFFDISDTGAPRGVGIDDGTFLNGPATGWNDAVAFSSDGSGTVGRLAEVVLDGTITPDGGTALTATNLNSPTVATNGIGIYTPAWGSVARSRTVDGAGSTRELEIRDGVVTAVRTSPGSAAVPAGSVVVLGRENGATALSGIAVGDSVDVSYAPSYDGAEAYAAISGNLVLLRDGVVDVPDHPRNPRTGVGFSADGQTMWLVALDGRSSSSTGMTYREFANFMKQLGADDALNLDGGGSTTMVAKSPSEIELSVWNDPSDGSQRTVPNGLGFTSTAFPPACIRATYNFTSYASLSDGASGSAVLAAQCLLKFAGTFAGAPNSSYDTATIEAVEAFQTARGLPSTGTIESHTWTALLSKGSTPTLREGSTGIAVKRLQRSLTAALGQTVAIDGDFGPATETAVRSYQSSRGLDVDGIVGAQTWGALQSGK